MKVPKYIVFFDGHCNLCNRAVDFLIQLDKKNILYYAPITGETAKKLNLQIHENESEQSIIFYRKDLSKIDSHSDAVLEIASLVCPIKFFWSILKLFPKSLRDLIYKVVAKYRYRFFGKTQTCRLPSTQEQSRFLD